MRYVLALDQGTTSSRAILFDHKGVARAAAQQELPQSFPREGWVEHDPNAIWQTQLEVARAALLQAGLDAGSVDAIGITNQRETTVIWDRASGEPVFPAIVWQDRRTAPECARLRLAGAETLCRERTGLLLDPYFSATKIAWILDHVAGARDRAERGELAFGTVDSWLVYRLTGGRTHVTDETNGARTLLFDIRTRRWDDELLALFRVPRAMLPRVVPSSGMVAETDPALFGTAIPIAGIAGDQQAALFGQRCVAPGMVKNTYGTGCFALMHAGTRCVVSQHRLLTTLACGEAGEARYALEGSVFIAGALVQWLRDGLGVIAAASEVEPLAASVPDSGGVVVVPALTGLGAPHWDPDARGSIHGLTRGTTRAHIARAVLEAIALASADLVDAMRVDAGAALGGMRVDGGAARNDLLMQIQADVLQAPVVRPRVTETTALGAAYLAGLAVGFWSGAAALEAQWQIDRTFEPSMPTGALAALRSRWGRAIERSKAWAVDESR